MAQRRRSGLGKPPPRPRAPKPIKVPQAPTISPVLNDVVKRVKSAARQEAQISQARARAQAMGKSTTPRNPGGPRRPQIPSADELFGGEPDGSGAYDDTLLGGGVDLSVFEEDTAEEQRARRAEVTRFVSPAPTSCPPRPRALEYKYDPQRQVLTMVFRDGGTYEYAGVPRRVFYNLTRVKSTGRFLDRNIKGVFPYTKVSG